METGNEHWIHSDPRHVTNETGFTALPGGFINEYGDFNELGRYGNWWGDRASYIIVLEINENGDIHKNNPHSGSDFGYSVRCIKGTNIQH
jgi:uncharacterized protein (TIGR02145 family)